MPEPEGRTVIRFTRLPEAVWYHVQSIGLSGIAVFAAIASFFAYGDLLESAYAYPSVAQLAAKIGLKRRAVQLALDHLEGCGLVAREVGRGPRGTSVFRLGPGVHVDAPPVHLDAPPANAGAPPMHSGAPPPCIVVHPFERSSSETTGKEGDAPGGASHPLALSETDQPRPAPRRTRKARETPADHRGCRRVWSAYLETLAEVHPGTRRKLIGSRRQAIVEAVEQWGEDDVLDAARGWRFDDWVVSHNYDLAFILREANIEAHRDAYRKRVAIAAPPVDLAAERALRCNEIDAAGLPERQRVELYGRANRCESLSDLDRLSAEIARARASA
jgi:hypothetical protein